VLLTFYFYQFRILDYLLFDDLTANVSFLAATQVLLVWMMGKLLAHMYLHNVPRFVPMKAI
jgi:hypothetical protein